MSPPTKCPRKPWSPSAAPAEALELLHTGIAAANRTNNQHALAEMDALREDLAQR